MVSGGPGQSVSTSVRVSPVTHGHAEIAAFNSVTMRVNGTHVKRKASVSQGPPKTVANVVLENVTTSVNGPAVGIPTTNGVTAMSVVGSGACQTGIGLETVTLNSITAAQILGSVQRVVFA